MMKRQQQRSTSQCAVCTRRMRSSQSSTQSSCGYTCPHGSKSGMKKSLSKKSSLVNHQCHSKKLHQGLPTSSCLQSHNQPLYASYDQHPFQAPLQSFPDIVNINAQTTEAPLSQRVHSPYQQLQPLLQEGFHMSQPPLNSNQLHQQFNNQAQVREKTFASEQPFRPFKTFQSHPFSYPSQERRSLTPPQKQSHFSQDMLSPSKQIQQHYEKVMQEMELYNRERMVSLREGLARLQEECQADEIINAMRSDPSSASFTYLRMKEVMDNALLAESEQVMANLRNENSLLKQKVYYLERDHGNSKSKGQEEDNGKLSSKAKTINQRKEHYKNQYKQSQDQISQLIRKLKEMEEEMQRSHEAQEIRVAQKDGELAQCERLLSEVRAMLSEKNLQTNRTQCNLSNELSVMSDRIQSLEKEKHELVDKYQRYGDEFKQMLSQDQQRSLDKMNKLKSKLQQASGQVELSENKARELESQARSYVKEVDDQRFKIEELVKQNQEKVTQIKDFTDNLNLAQRDLKQALKEQKQKFKSKMEQLQHKFEQGMVERLREIEGDARQKIEATELEKADLEQRLTALHFQMEQQSNVDKQQLTQHQQQVEKQIDKLTKKYEKEIESKLEEAEAQFKELETNLRKEQKKEKKQLHKQIDELNQAHQIEVNNKKEEALEEYREMSLKLRGELDQHQKEQQELRIKLAEQKLNIDNLEGSNLELTTERDNLKQQIDKLETSHNNEVAVYESQLRQKLEENDTKVKQALDDAIKTHNVETIAHQYAAELDKIQNEIKLERDSKQALKLKLEGSIGEQGNLMKSVQNLKILLQDKEGVLYKQTLTHKDALQKLQHFVKMQLSKQKSETDFLKKQFTTELEMNRKHIESQLQAICIKAREQMVTRKFQLEKAQYSYEQKYQQDFSRREIEWEKAWEKREACIKEKDLQIRELESEKEKLRESHQKQELELTKTLTQLHQLKKDTKKQVEDLQSQVKQAEAKTQEFMKSFRTQEDLLQSQFKQQIQDQKQQIHLQTQDQLKKLEQQMQDYREKSKKKVKELTTHLSEQQSRYRQEIVNMKNVYEEKVKAQGQESETQQKSIFEIRNQVNLLEMEKKQLTKDKERAESEADSLKNSGLNLSLKFNELERDYQDACVDRDNILKEKEMTEQEQGSLQEAHRALQAQLYQVERKYTEYKRKLQTNSKRLQQSKRKEQQDIRLLNDILTTSAQSARKLSRHTSLASPEFKRPVTVGFATHSSSSKRNYATGNTTQILSEINNMIDPSSLKYGSHQKSSCPRSILKNSTNNHLRLTSPMMHDLNPSKSYSHQSVYSPPSDSNKENPMTFSQLKQQ